jgi:hypothetical protein
MTNKLASPCFKGTVQKVETPSRIRRGLVKINKLVSQSVLKPQSRRLKHNLQTVKGTTQQICPPNHAHGKDY